MAKNYLQVVPVPGKWYVSERFQASSAKWHITAPAESRPKRSPAEMIVAGPFDSRDQAMLWNTQTSTSGYVWEMVQSTSEPPLE